MSLTQPQTLMGLLPQLKSMEENIVSMIMELSTKLANLTDAHIFVLVDVTNQRRFSGTQHLVDQYLSGGLAPIGNGNDVELQVSVEPSVIPKFPSNVHNGNDVRGFCVDASPNPLRNVKRRGGDDSDPSNRKKVKKWNNEQRSIVSSESVKAEPIFAHEVDLTLEGDGMYEEVSLNTDDFAFCQRETDNISGNNIGSFDASSENQALCVTDSTAMAMRFHDTNDMLVHLDDLNLPAQKIEFLQSVQETEKLFVKGSPETKIVTSLMYDFGKSLHAAFTQYVSANAAEDPLMLVKPFLNANLDAFLELFPNLRLEIYHNIRIENRKPKAFMKRHTENSFNRCMRESLKNISNLNASSHHPIQYDQDSVSVLPL